MVTLRTAITLLVAAGLSIGGMMAAGDQVRAKVRSTARSAVQAAGEIVADLHAGADELVRSVEVRAETQTDVGAGAEGQVESNHNGLNLNTETQTEAEARSGGSLEIGGPFDLRSWFDLDLFGSADGRIGW